MSKSSSLQTFCAIITSLATSLIIVGCADSVETGVMIDQPSTGTKKTRQAKRWRNKKLLKRLNDEVTQAMQQSQMILPDVVSVKVFSASPLFREMLKDASTQDLEWLAANIPSYPAKLAPFVIAVEKHKTVAPRVAVRVIASSEPLPALLAAPVILYLNRLSIKHTSSDDLKLDSVTEEYNDHRGALAVLASALPYEIIEQWFRKKKSPSCRNTLYLYVLSELFAECPKGKEPSKAMKNALRECSRKSSLGRVVFVYHASEREPSYLSVLRQCLADKSVSKLDLIGVLAAKREYIKKHIDIKTLSLSPARRKEIQQIWDPPGRSGIK